MVGPTQLAVLSLQLGQALSIRGRGARTNATVDLGLPDLPGMDLARRLADRAPELRIVFSSGYALPRHPPGWNDRAAAVDKPIDLELLAAVLAELGIAVSP